MSALIPAREEEMGAAAPPVGAVVGTPFGEGKLVRYYANDHTGGENMAEVKLSGWKATAYVQAAQVEWKKKLFEMTTLERIDKAKFHKSEGNALYKAGKFLDAIKKYELALIFMKQLGRPCTKEELESVVHASISNIAIARFKMKQYGEAARRCTEVLASSPEHIKALYWRASALVEMGKQVEALKDLHAAKEACAGKNSKSMERNVRILIAKVKKQMSKAKRKTKQMFAKAFGAAKSTQKNAAAALRTTDNGHASAADQKPSVVGQKRGGAALAHVQAFGEWQAQQRVQLTAQKPSALLAAPSSRWITAASAMAIVGACAIGYFCFMRGSIRSSQR